MGSVSACCSLADPRACFCCCRSTAREFAAAVSTGGRRVAAARISVPYSPPAVLPAPRGPRLAAALISGLFAPAGRRWAGRCAGSRRSVPPASTAAGSHGEPLRNARGGWLAVALLAEQDRPVLSAPPADRSSRLLLCPACHSQRSSSRGAQPRSPPRGASLHGPRVCPRALPAAADLMTRRLPSCRTPSCHFRHACHGHLCALPRFASTHA
jgi:hypothetical protein